MDDDVLTVLWTPEQLLQRVCDLALQITHDFSSRDSSSPVIVGVATGAFLFLADLVRNIKLPVTIDFVRAESYGSGTVSSGPPKISCDVKLDVAGKHVILCPDSFVVGYGLDFNERYRNLPYIGVLKPEIYRSDNDKHNN
ncbi:hypothetical protein L1987_23530 [Smallanthus sonchifolius]|uniref:Uncharacterized protein n=1 Tax=Smallanthus sonchifolius TaxID=185202 RepID=A0ACB9IHX9_9ASTR|nr:hypothetical protein L1987_23530 [Smallanthus sonchifolius]